MSTPTAPSDAPLDETTVPAPGRARWRRRAAKGSPAAAARTRRRSKQRRRVANVSGLLLGLVLTGALYSTFSPARAAGDATTDQATIDAGKAIYDRACITCHGSNLQGVPHRGPSLIGVGSAAVFFQVHTGRMPLARQEAEAQDKPPVFSETQIVQLGAYV